MVSGSRNRDLGAKQVVFPPPEVLDTCAGRQSWVLLGGPRTSRDPTTRLRLTDNGKSALSNSSKDHGGPDGMEPDGIIEVCAWRNPIGDFCNSHI